MGVFLATGIRLINTCTQHGVGGLQFVVMTGAERK